MGDFYIPPEYISYMWINMATPKGKTTVSKMVNLSFRQQFGKQTRCSGRNLRQCLAAMAGEVTISRLEEIKKEFPNARQFIEEELVWVN